MHAFSIEHLSRRYQRNGTPALDAVTLAMPQGKVMALVGESGSGKSTLLRLLAGLETPDNGTVTIHGNLVAGPTTWVPVEKRNIGLVFQDGALFPHLTIAKNIAYGLSKQKDRPGIIQHHLQLVGLAGYENRYPHQLSGGERQRVALARALAPQPALLLLDEPFSNLDPSLRRDLRAEIGDILHRVNASALLVTHDSEDALGIADQTAILRNGKLEQQGPTAEVYQHPANVYCANLFGPAIQINGHIYRPNQLQVSDTQHPNAIEVTIRQIQHLGNETKVTIQPTDAPKTNLALNVPPEPKWEPGQTAWLSPENEPGAY